MIYNKLLSLFFVSEVSLEEDFVYRSLLRNNVFYNLDRLNAFLLLILLN